MKIILNGINGEYLRYFTDNFVHQTEFVEAAVAYATDESLLFNWCWDNHIPVRYWGRYDDSVPVALRILKSFLDRKSPNFLCKLLTHFHAKVIWWHGVGAYMGSANLSDPAWYGNIEAGCFFDDAEMLNSGMDRQLHGFFRKVDEHSSPLTEELYREIESRSRQLQRLAEQDRDQKQRFGSSKNIHHWSGLLRQSPSSAREQQRGSFLDEWNATLQTLRDIGDRVSADEFRPSWIPSGVPMGAQADQFLHAHYYSNVFDKQGRSQFAEMFEHNKGDPERALRQAMTWWHNLPEPPSGEDRTLVEWAPFLRERLAPDYVLTISPAEFEEVCQRVWSIRDHARRVSNDTLGLPDDRRHNMDVKTHALAQYLYSRKAKNGANALQVIHHVLYDGSLDDVPSRLWEATSDGAWRIEHLGISALGELVGWALPDAFPPRNNRTSKSLRSLGFDVDFVG